MIRSAFKNVFLLIPGLFGLLLGLGACSSSSELTDPSDPARISSRYVPSVATVDHSPDSLVGVSVAADSARILLEDSYTSLLQKWSVGQRYLQRPSTSHRPFRSILGRGERTDVDQYTRSRSGPPRRFSVLRSKELLLGALAEKGADSLSAATVRSRLRQKAAFYRDTLRIDVYLVGTPPIRRVQEEKIELQDDRGRVYSPVDETFQSGTMTVRGASYAYLRESYYFDRTTEEHDFVRNTSLLRLKVYNVYEGPWYFEWKWNRSRLSTHE